MNEELQGLFEQDQADRRTFEQLDHEQIQQMLQRDRERRKGVEEIIRSKALQAPEDYFHAAMVFQQADGQDVTSWFKVPESKLSSACREEEIPQLESIQLGEQTAILLKSADASFTQLFMRSGDAFYVVGGQVALNELMQIATCIPYSQF